MPVSTRKNATNNATTKNAVGQIAAQKAKALPKKQEEESSTEGSKKPAAQPSGLEISAHPTRRNTTIPTVKPSSVPVVAEPHPAVASLATTSICNASFESSDASSASNNVPNDASIMEFPSNSTLEQEVGGLLNEPEALDLGTLCRMLEDNKTLYGSEEATAKLRGLQFNSSDYENSKARIINRFFLILSIHPNFKPLTVVVDDPEVPGTTTRLFYIRLPGPRTPLKKRSSTMRCFFFHNNASW